MQIYVASSWRNNYQQDVIRAVREVGHEAYDFRNPRDEGPPPLEGMLDRGFGWREMSPNWENWDITTYLEALNHPLAEAGYLSDWLAMEWADACILVMPCGRSAHLEAGYFVGAKKPLLMLLSNAEPELMYKMADSCHAGLGSLLLRLQEIEHDLTEYGDTRTPSQPNSAKFTSLAKNGADDARNRIDK